MLGLGHVRQPTHRSAVPEENPGRQGRLDRSVRSAHVGPVGADPLPSDESGAGPDAAGEGGRAGLRGEMRGGGCLRRGRLHVRAAERLALSDTGGEGSAGKLQRRQLHVPAAVHQDARPSGCAAGGHRGAAGGQLYQRPEVRFLAPPHDRGEPNGVSVQSDRQEQVVGALRHPARRVGLGGDVRLLNDRHRDRRPRPRPRRVVQPLGHGSPPPAQVFQGQGRPHAGLQAGRQRLLRQGRAAVAALC